MAKKDPPKPIFPLKHEFYASLDNYVHVAGMLADVVRQALEMNMVDKKVADIMRERLTAFEDARSGDH